MLLEFITTVRSLHAHRVCILTEVVQQAPDCDMALVHDDDLVCIKDGVRNLCDEAYPLSYRLNYRKLSNQRK
jgi:hypothetical protein